ncbi:MAG: FHA domain-containing protein [Pseudomonadota bacterium]|nr:FHA domain-containing protein [Pseudomonadota bacterium]
MRAFVTFRLPDDRLVNLEHGALIGRLRSAALVLDDPRISEGHALVSLRGGAFSLLSLRRMFAVDGRPRSDVTLRPGLRVSFADGLVLAVEAVHLPEAVLALEGDGLARTVLPGVCALRLGPPVQVVPQHDARADAWIWSIGDAWRLRLAGPNAEDRPLAPGDEVWVGGRSFTAVLQPLDPSDATHMDGGIAAPIRLVSRFETVTIHRAGHPPLVLVGQLARILSELVSMGGLAEWDTLAREVWPDEKDVALRRRKWDVSLARLRQKLKEAGVRGDLLRPDGMGRLELVRYDGDVVEDAS